MPSLKKQSDFKTLREQGNFVHVTHWLAVSYQSNNTRNLNWAWTLSRKIGNAVTRNRLKRWGREFLREFGTYDIDINFIFKIKKPEFYKQLSRKDFDVAFKKAFEKVG